MKKEELSKIHRNEEELLVKTTELDCLKRELQEKTNELNKEREKLEVSIRSEQVRFFFYMTEEFIHKVKCFDFLIINLNLFEELEIKA